MLLFGALVVNGLLRRDIVGLPCTSRQLQIPILIHGLFSRVNRAKGRTPVTPSTVVREQVTAASPSRF